MKKIALSLTILLGALSASNATAFDGDVNAGKEKSATCAACHGPDGNAPVNIYPKIAGQHPDYILKQLQDLKLGMTSGGKEGRMDPVMSAMAMPLSEQDMKDLAAYFSSMNMSEGATPKDVVEVGEMLFKAGDAERGIPSCAACHGQNGEKAALGKSQIIQGWDKAKVIAALNGYKDGSYGGVMKGVMKGQVVTKSDAEIDALAEFISNL